MLRYFLTLSIFDVDLVWYVGFVRKKLAFLNSLSNISMWIYGNMWGDHIHIKNVKNRLLNNHFQTF